MKGFEIEFNQEKKKVGIKNGMLTIHIFDNNGDARMYIGGVDYKRYKEFVWYNWIPIKLGDKISTKLTELVQSSEPYQETENQKIIRPKTKLEIFREMEDRLKRKGLL